MKTPFFIPNGLEQWLYNKVGDMVGGPIPAWLDVSITTAEWGVFICAVYFVMRFVARIYRAK